jgi:putative DNA primase/helicase
MSDDTSNRAREDLDEIRREVEDRAADEATKLAQDEETAKAAKPEKPERILHPFVVDCCKALDKGMGVMFATMMRGRYVYAPEKKQWYEWQEHYWTEVIDEKVGASVERVAERLAEAKSWENGILKELDPEDKEARGYHKANLTSVNRRINALHEIKGVQSCIKFSLQNDRPLISSAQDMNKTPRLIACENGVVDMRTGELSPGRPEDYITRLCPVKWKSINEPAVKWASMVHEILGENDDVYRYFQKLVGYAMCGKVTEKLFVILLGEEGDSGKTTIFETLYEIVRDYASPMPVELLLEQGGAARDPNAPSPAIMDLLGLRLTWASEPGENRRFSIDRIKLMSGNDSLVGRYPHDKSPTKFTPTHTLFLLTNHKLRASAHDTAFWGRVRLLDCPYSFVANPTKPNQRKRRVGLKEEIIAEEAAGVLAWIVRGYQLYLQEGLDPPADVLKSTALYQREEDYIAEWMDACVEVIEDAHRYETLAEAYELYRAWHLHCYGQRTLPSQIKFGKLAGRVITKSKVGGQMRFYGIRILPEAIRQYLDKK